MFLEFPKDVFTFSLSSQFMVGDDFLFALKNTAYVVNVNGTTPTRSDAWWYWDENYQKIEAYLPQNEQGDLLWYDYSTKQP